jgi:hypothetical protein
MQVRCRLKNRANKHFGSVLGCFYLHCKKGFFMGYFLERVGGNSFWLTYNPIRSRFVTIVGCP